MIAPADLVGAVEVLDATPTGSGVLVTVRVEDPILGRVDEVRLAAPHAAAGWDATTLAAWVRETLIKRAANVLEREIDAVVDALRAGKNPLRDAQGRLYGTAHLPYAEAAAVETDRRR